jgi:hypothetical protein
VNVGASDRDSPVIGAGSAIAARDRMRILPALTLVLIAWSLARPVSAQPAPQTACRIVGTDVTCTNLHPVSETAATAIMTAAIRPLVPEPVAPSVLFAGEVHPIRGEVFSDRWPYAAAGVYPWLLPRARASGLPPAWRHWYRRDR